MVGGSWRLRKRHGMFVISQQLTPQRKTTTNTDQTRKGEQKTERKGQGEKKAPTNLARHIRIQPRKHNRTLPKLLRHTPLHDQIPHRARYRIRLLPRNGLAIRFARGAFGGAEGGDDEVGVGGEEGDEALAYGAGCAEDADGDFLAFEDHCW